MGIFDNLKKKILGNKINKRQSDRLIKILPLIKYHNILVVIDKVENEKEINNHLELVFPNSKITSLSFRDTKIDESSGYHFSFHKADLGLNKIKNERLIGLINTNFDLIIDFSLPAENTI